MSDTDDIEKKETLAAPAKTKPSKKEAKLLEKEEKGEFFKTVLMAIALAIVIRSLFLEPFNIPSGSMKPTLLVGDYLFVSKPAYGYSKYSFPFSDFVPIEGRVWNKKPKRGDVIVFKLPSNPRIDYIKRIVAMPGERVQVIRGILHINGSPVKRELVGEKTVHNDYGGESLTREYIETLPGGIQHAIYEDGDNEPLDNTDVTIVPDGHYFVMGDNRDNSQDSRVNGIVGPVPFENIVGRASFLFFSIGESADLAKPWTWPFAVRYSRIFDGIGPKHPADSE